MKIAIGSDHAGFRYKEAIKELLRSLRHEVTDFGTHSEEPVDYPLFIRPVAEAVARDEFERGVVLGGSGNGEAITANRVKGVRCALCWNVESAGSGGNITMPMSFPSANGWSVSKPRWISCGCGWRLPSKAEDISGGLT